MPFFKKKHKENKQGQRKPSSPRMGAEKDDSRKRYSVNIEELRDRDSSRSPTPSASMYEIGNSSSLGRAGTVAGYKPRTELARETSNTSVSRKRAYFEDVAEQKSSSSGASVNAVGKWSPEKRQGVNMTQSPSRSGPMIPSQPGVSVSITSPTSILSGRSYTSHHLPSHTSDLSSPSSTQQLSNTGKQESSPMSDILSSNLSREKSLSAADLPLPPLQTTSVRHRHVLALKNAPGGGFGFILQKSYLPVPDDPDKTCLVHLVEPRADYTGPLMTGDRIIEVNGESVDEAPHERVVELIKASGDSVQMVVASMPELLELNTRGAFDNALKPLARTQLRKSGRAKTGTGTLRKNAAEGRKAFKAKSAEEVLLEQQGLEKVWVVHTHGFTLGTVINDTPKRSNLSAHFTLVRYQGKETRRVKLQHSGGIIEVDEVDLEKANPESLDKVEDIVNLVHLNESSVLHVLRQRYGSTLIHTFAGKHLIVINPLRPLSSYVDRVIDMFRGCRREDMPPHIFAAGQQAYRNMMVTRNDQSLILMGLSGAGKTFNARYLLRYLATIGQPEHGPITNAKLDAVELLLHSFGSAATFLNPQATRCSYLYSLEFDPSGTLVAAAVRTFLLEKYRVAQRPGMEGNFNIFYQLIAGADSQLSSDLLLNVPVESEEENIYIEPYDDPQRIESAAVVWDLIQNCLEILEISQEEAQGLWSLLAAIYHLGYAGVKKGSMRGSDCFLNPAAAQRAATVLGIDHEDLGRDIFNPPRGASLRLSTLFGSPHSSSPTPSETSSIQGSPFSHGAGNRSASLDAFVIGLYDQAFNALVMLINRALQSPIGIKGRSTIHVLDAPGFQHRELAGAKDGASFDDLCMNYQQERLQMLFHDSTFTSEQDRYIQENINWMFSEVGDSPLPVIDAIDKHVPQRRGGTVDLHTDRRGVLWILDEESVFPGASESSFLDRVHMYHGETDEKGESPLIKVLKEENQFIVFHCQRSLPVLYDTNGWVRRAREHPSTRIVVQVVAESKRPSIASIFQGHGVAASAINISTSALKVDTHHQSVSRTKSTQPVGIHFSSPSANIKKSSCLQTKFQLDYLIDTLRKTRQWFIHCLLPQPPYQLPGAISTTYSDLQKQAGSVPHGHIDISLVRAQLRRTDLVKAARMYKQGFPEHMTYSEFSRRYGALLGGGMTDGQIPDKESAGLILRSQEVDKSSFRIGLSQIFFRAGTLTQLDRQVEDQTHGTMVLFQARCRGWLGRQKFQKLEVQHSAALVIQDNLEAYMELREWSWWNLYCKVKPLLAVWRAGEELKERDSQIDNLKSKVEKLESERDLLKESERALEEKVAQMSAQLENVQLSATQASDLMEEEQLEKRTLQEQLTEVSANEAELKRENEQLHLQLAEMSILARIRQSEDGEGESSEAMLEKYWETRRELETLRQRISTEYEDEVERLESAKRSLEKKLVDSESEKDDLQRNLNQVRKKATKVASEMNDLKLHLETQQARNAELEKRQRKFDADLSAAKEEAMVETQAKEKLAREKDTLQTEYNELQEKLKRVEEERDRMQQEKEDLESEVLSHTSHSTLESEMTSIKKMKRELETRVEELEEELDEANVKVDSLQQMKARLEVANQTLRQQHQKEMEGRDDDAEQLKASMQKKVKSLTQQLEELHEEKQAAVKARRDMEREMAEYQNRLGDPEVEKKLRTKVRKYKTLLQDLTQELEHEREMRGNSAMVKSLRNQLDDLQASERTAVKAQKRLQEEVEELQTQSDELTRTKMELDSRVAELSREKSDLETRVEEDQDEIEELMGKQRAHISQMSAMQSQLTEANLQVEELHEAKQTLETKVAELSSKISELDTGFNRHQYEASEHKVKELEQKLELERSSARRHEAQIHRLRNQLERAQEDKSEDMVHKSSDALKRVQKQVRELRSELQEAERREQELSKKKRIAEVRVEELEAQVQSTEADLKSAQRRIDTLHSALKGQEDFSMGEEDYTVEDSKLIGDDLSSSGSSYEIGQFDDEGSLSGLSDNDPDTPRTRRRARIRARLRGSSPNQDLGISTKRKTSRRRDLLSDEDEFVPRRRINHSADELEMPTTHKSKYSDEFGTRGKWSSASKLDEGDSEFTSRRRDRFSEDELLDRPHRGSKEYLKVDEDFTSKRGTWRERIKLSDDDDEFSSRGKKDYSSKLSDDDLSTGRSWRRERIKLSDDDEFSSRGKKDYSSKLSDDDLSTGRSWRREQIKLSDDDDEFSSRGKKDYSSKLSDDDLSTGRSWRRERIKLSDDDDEFSSRGKKTKLSDEDSDLGRSRKSKRDYGAELEDDSDDDFLTRRRRDRIKLTDDEDFSTSRKTTTLKLSDGEKERDLSPSTGRRDYTSKLSDGEGEFSTRRHRRKDYPSKYSDNDLDHTDEDFKSKRGQHDYSNKSNGIEESNPSKFTNGTNEFSSPTHHSLITDPYQADKVATGMATSNGTEAEAVSKKGENEGERRKSVNEIVSGEQEQVYAASQRRRQRQRRRTADAKSKLRSPDHQASAL